MIRMYFFENPRYFFISVIALIIIWICVTWCIFVKALKFAGSLLQNEGTIVNVPHRQTVQEAIVITRGLSVLVAVLEILIYAILLLL